MAPPKVPASAATAPACTDFSSVDLKPFRELPPLSVLSASDKADPALMNYYDKVGAYIMMDASDYGIGNGNGALDQDEVQKFLTKFPSNNPKVTTCTLLGEARDFSKIAPSLTEAAQKGTSVAKAFESKTREVQQEAVAEKKSVPIWQWLMGLVLIGYVVKKIINRFRDNPPKDGGGTSGPQKPEPPKKKPVQNAASNGKSSESSQTLHATQAPEKVTTVPLNGDLNAQIQRMYGGTQIYIGAAAPSLAGSPSQGAGLPVVLPLVTPLPVTLPAVKPVPVVRPIPILAR